MKARGKAEPEDKTMVDALLPALDALRAAEATAPSSATRCAARPTRRRRA